MYFPCCVVLSRFSCVRLCVTLWTVARQAPLSMGFFRQECWSGLPYPPPGECISQVTKNWGEGEEKQRKVTDEK